MNQLEFYTLARSLFVPSETQASQFQKLTVERYHVSVSIDDRLATTEVDLIFSNPNTVSVGGLFLFLLPDGAKLRHRCPRCSPTNQRCESGTHLGKN